MRRYDHLVNTIKRPETAETGVDLRLSIASKAAVACTAVALALVIMRFPNYVMTCTFSVVGFVASVLGFWRAHKSRDAGYKSVTGVTMIVGLALLAYLSWMGIILLQLAAAHAQ